MPFPILVLAAVFLLIAFRRFGRVPVRIWQAMAGGAAAVVMAGSLSPAAALAAIDRDVMLFLFGMFVVGEALVKSGELYRAAYGLFGYARSTGALVLLLLCGAGLASALLMNDTLAVVGTPLALRLAAEHRIDPRLLLMTLAVAVTTGSVMSPIGNPQNLLIALHGPLANPFVAFLATLGLPTLPALLAAYGVLRLAYRREFHPVPLVHTPVAVGDRALARLTRLAVALVTALVAIKVALVLLGLGAGPRLSLIALAGAAPLLLFSRRRGELLRDIDWPTLLFFAALFVLMAAVWQSGFFQQGMARLELDPAALPTVLGVGVLGSQLISNVPLVALYLPLLEHAGAGPAAFLALAAGATLAGNLLLLGAASNVIVVQGAERRGVHLGFGEFARVGVPLTALQVGIYWLFL